METDEQTPCLNCNGAFTADKSDAVDTGAFCSAECEHEHECSEEVGGCEYPAVHISDKEDPDE